MRIEFFNDALEKHCQFGRKGTEIGQSKERCQILTFYKQKTGLKELLSCKYVLQICETETWVSKRRLIGLEQASKAEPLVQKTEPRVSNDWLDL